MTHRIGQGCAVLQRGDGCLAAGHGLGQLLHSVPSVGEKLVVTVEDGDLRRAVQSGLHADGGNRAACAQHHQTLAPDLHAVFVEIADKADAVGVVTGESAVLADGNGVAGADESGGGGQLVHQPRHGGPAGHGDVEAANAQGFQCSQALLHLLQGDVRGQIGGVLAGAGEAVASQGHAVNCQRKRRRQQRGQLFRRVQAYPKGDDANA